MLVPSWVMVLFWLCGSWMAITGMLDNDIAQPALGGGLILIILLIGFTVMQHAFAGGALHQGLFSDLERQALAVAGSGDIVWDWDVLRDRVVTKPDVSVQLGLTPNSLGGAARNWLPVLHADDRDTFRTTLDVVLEHRRGRVSQNFRLRGADGHYHWFSLRARPVIGSDGEVIRCVGTMVDVTEQKKSEERLLHDAVHDNLTGLPNRELYMNRLEAIISIARTEEKVRPTVFVIDIDRFKQVNDGLGISAGDTILLTIARRLHRLLKPKDSLSRFAGDQFALMLLSEQDPARIAAVADAIKHAINNPITFAKREIVLTASIGLITWTTAQTSAEDMVKDAELAMHQAKRFGGDRIEPFRPAFRTVGTDRLQFESDLRRAIERHEFTLAYQPIVRLEDGSVAGFEALLRWDHPRRGMIPPGDFIPVAENCGLIVQLGLFAMQQAAEDLATWQKQIGDAPLSVSVNLSSRQLHPPRPGQRRPLGHRASQSEAALLPAGTYRIAGDGQSRADIACAEQAEAARHRPVAGRFRHRLFVTVLSDALPVRHDQDRQELRRRCDAEARGAAEIHGQHGARTWSVGGRRRHLRRERCAGAAPDGLRICAELHVRRADARRPGAEDAEGTVSAYSGVMFRRDRRPG